MVEIKEKMIKQWMEERTLKCVKMKTKKSHGACGRTGRESVTEERKREREKKQIFIEERQKSEHVDIK